MSGEIKIVGQAPVNTTTIPVGFVQPQVPSQTQLGPGVYSLSKRSNVPFVALVGSSGYRKVISWGELVEVPCGQLVTVWNASYHAGDIWINKGRDENNCPARITVPVRFQEVTVDVVEGESNAWTPLYPCDTRSARRAYLCIDARVNPNFPALPVFIRGRRLDGSMNTDNSLAEYDPPYGPGVGFLCALSYTGGQALTYIPLGLNASPDDDTRPHNLLDAGDVFILLGDGTDLVTAFDWPASVGGEFSDVFPESPAPAPGAWYVLEY